MIHTLAGALALSCAWWCAYSYVRQRNYYRTALDHLHTVVNENIKQLDEAYTMWKANPNATNADATLIIAVARFLGKMTP